MDNGLADLFILCSDGLNSMLTDDEILETVLADRQDLDKIAQNLIKLANLRGGEDNITLILVEVAEDGSDDTGATPKE